MRDKYGVIQDNYCYLNSDVLVNKLNIKEHDNLAEAELAFTAVRYIEYSSTITSINQFNLSHLQQLHFQLFQDIYDWAGEIRKVDIAKGTTRFCTCSRIEAETQKQLSRIPLLLNSTTQEKLIAELADIFCELNIIHPFREGNGRTQRFFFEELYFFLGMNITWPDISKGEWVQANVNGYNGDLSSLEAILREAISDNPL
ncbi:Fic family protein [Colwellia sp. MSW7]|jgi:cell filamentation protein|uniref:protein adenylyltransferase n=1 Tax=Colwellia maritima TaxID=2912588 RepID=A0ABS9X5I2_9GAMM|nr:Fic family protein [Colwellia maritima]MCI2285459.1 Fic family protein [Colwellia maritima]